MIKQVDSEGRVEFSKAEAKRLIRHMGYRSTNAALSLRRNIRMTKNVDKNGS